MCVMPNFQTGSNRHIVMFWILSHLAKCLTTCFVEASDFVSIDRTASSRVFRRWHRTCNRTKSCNGCPTSQHVVCFERAARVFHLADVFLYILAKVLLRRIMDTLPYACQPVCFLVVVKGVHQSTVSGTLDLTFLLSFR